MGYVVYNESGDCPLSWGASEEYFKSLNHAVNKALSFIKSYTLDLEHISHKTLIYTADEDITKTSHQIPPENSTVILYCDNLNIKNMRVPTIASHNTFIIGDGGARHEPI